jgi:hypothetical protein
VVIAIVPYLAYQAPNTSGNYNGLTILRIHQFFWFPVVYVKMLTSTLCLLGLPSHYDYILHDNLNTMLGKTSVSMMVLLVAASLIGISSIHQYVEGQTPKPQ